jgi:hypothetical protein
MDSLFLGVLAWNMFFWTRNISKWPLDGCLTLGFVGFVVPAILSPVGPEMAAHGPMGYVIRFWMVRLLDQELARAHILVLSSAEAYLGL